MGERRREAWAKWRGLVSEQAGSGQTVAAFCRQRGLPASQFFAWKRRLRQTAAEGFVEVQLVCAAPRRTPGYGRAIEVRLSGGHSILVEPGFEADHLRAVVAALERRA
jgi:transposase-like protein